MAEYARCGRHVLYCGDALAQLRALADASVDAFVSDPPYELAFMGQDWDRQGMPFRVGFWREVRRVLKPGAHLLAFGGTRTYHRMACAIEDAEFEIRDSLMWVYASGFPKSLNISKELDRLAGAEREVIGQTRAGHNALGQDSGWNTHNNRTEIAVTAPATDLARAWDGWGTGLKPANEPIVLARAPLSEASIARNVARWGTGALNIDGCRVGVSSTPRLDPRNGNLVKAHMEMRPWMERRIMNGEPLKGDFAGDQGRWPPNLVFSHSLWCTPAACAEGCPVAELDRQSGERPAGSNRTGREPSKKTKNTYGEYASGMPWESYGDTGGASRFFPVFDWTAEDRLWLPFYYTPKPGRSERDKGCEALATAPKRSALNTHNGTSERFDGAPTPQARNTHPTVKPVALMRWLVRLVTPPGGIVLDPFGGSGTTCIAADQEGAGSIYIDQGAEYCEIARARIVGDAPLLFAEAAS